MGREELSKAEVVELVEEGVEDEGTKKRYFKHFYYTYSNYLKIGIFSFYNTFKVWKNPNI